MFDLLKNRHPEIEWHIDPSVATPKWGLMKMPNSDQWAVVQKEFTMYGWSDPRTSWEGDTYTHKIVTFAPSKKVAIGFIKLLMEK